MNKKHEIIEFEDVFKNEISKKKIDPTPENKSKYFSAIMVYFLIMLVFSTILFLLASEVPILNETLTESELIVEKISEDAHGIALINPAIYLSYEETYGDYITVVADYEGYSIIINSGNTSYQDIFFITDELTSETDFNPLSIEQVFGASPTVTYWNIDQDAINIYAGETQLLPSFFQTEYIIIKGPETRISSFTESLINFLTYLALIPAIFLLLKVEFKQDYMEFKLIKNEWFLIIIVGYLTLMLGNVVSIFASEYLGNLFGIAPSEAVNQLTIIRSLMGPGAIFMFLSAVIMGPIIEELIYRKAFFGLIKNDKIALVVSSLVFGSIHLIGEASILGALVNGISYYVMGFIFGYIYLKNHKNIMAPIAVHILSNLISILAILFIL
ncbi:MAG TPA: hypothetical protein DEP70_01995 [Acholeplasmataceae bacterium]|nr:hypothetical protein [Acholeplasmataceae bacterium]